MVAIRAEQDPFLRVLPLRTPETPSPIINLPVEMIDHETRARLEVVEMIVQIRNQFGIPPSFTATLNEIIDALSSYAPATREGDLVFKVSNFNVLDNRTRFLELQSRLQHNSSQEKSQEVLKQKYELLWGNFISYLKEYVLFEQFSEYMFKPSDLDPTEQTMQGFEFTTLQELCQKTVDIFAQRGFRMDRITIENKVYPILLKMIVEMLPVGTEFYICSPPGTKAEGYIGKSFYFIGEPSYSFVNGYTVILDPESQQKTLVLHQYARWMTLQDHVEFIEHFGGPFDKNLALNDKNIILHPFFPKDGYMEKDIAQYLERFKSRVPKSRKERVVDKKAFEQQARVIFDHFYFPLIDQFIQQPLDQKMVEKMELAFSFAQRKLMHWIDQEEAFQTKKTATSAAAISLEEIQGTIHKPGLEKIFWEHASATIDNTIKFKSEKERDIHLARLKSHFGKNMGTILGIGQCYGSELVKLTQGLDILNGKAQTHSQISQFVGEEEAKEWHKGKCITCGYKGMVGPCEICSGCDNRFPNTNWFSSLISSVLPSSIPPLSATPLADQLLATSDNTLIQLAPEISISFSEAMQSNRNSIGLNEALNSIAT